MSTSNDNSGCLQSQQAVEVFAIAFKLHALGFSVVPSGGGESGKAPTVNWREYQQRQPDNTELETWQQKLKPNLWGIVTGAISGLVVVDTDDAETRATMEASGLKPHVITPRGGAHFYFKHPGHHIKTIAGLLPKIDIRGDGGFVNVVGRRADGEYKIVNNTTEKVELKLDAIETVWQLFHRRLRQKAIFEKTGLPVPLVRAVLHGRYQIKGDNVVVDVPAMPPRESRW